MKRKRVPPNMAAQVLLTFGSDCWLDMPGCTHRGTETMDHVKPYSLYGPTVPSNLRPACKHCNSLRADRVVSGFGAQVTAVIGPPCVGKTAYVRDHMAPGDIVVDPSRLAVACVDGGSEAHALADTLWGSAYRRVSRMVTARHVWLVRALPTSRNSPNMLAEWIALNYDVVVLDADDQLLRGRMAECRRGREDVELLKRWRRQHASEGGRDAGDAAHAAFAASPDRRPVFAAGRVGAAAMVAGFLNGHGQGTPRAHRFRIPNPNKKSRAGKGAALHQSAE